MPDVPPPSYAQVVAVHNARTARLEAFTVLADIILRGRDIKGADQAEGLVSFIRPSKVALRVSKVGQTLFRLGSDGLMYWWIDLTGDSPIALTGRFENATPERVSRLGIPVHPLDLPELLGIVPLPEDDTGRVVWSIDGKSVVVTIPSRWNGTKSLVLEPGTLLPRSVEMRDALGRIAMISELSRHELIPVRGDALSRPLFPMRCEVRVPDPPTSLTLIMHDAQNPGIDRIQKTQFNFQSLSRSISNLRVVSLDEDGPRTDETEERPAHERGGPDGEERSP